MDSVTQILLGVTTSEVGFRRRLGKSANWLAGISALFPDLDFLFYPFSREWWFMTDHRGISHSFLLVFLLPWPLAWLFWRKRKQENPYYLFFLCSLISMASHLFLDLCTSYGTPVFLPFTNRRWAWDFIGIVDLIYTLILIFTLVGCYLLRQKARSDLAPLFSLVGFMFSAGYIGLGAYFHTQALGVAQIKALELKEKPIQIKAYPNVGLISGFRLVIETEEAFWVSRVNMLTHRRVEFVVLPKSKGRMVEIAFSHPRVRQYYNFALGMVRPVERKYAGKIMVDFEDMRYSIPQDNYQTTWLLRVVFNERDEISSVYPVTQHLNREEMGKVFRAYWREIWN